MNDGYYKGQMIVSFEWEGMQYFVYLGYQCSPETCKGHPYKGEEADEELEIYGITMDGKFLNDHHTMFHKRDERFCEAVLQTVKRKVEDICTPDPDGNPPMWDIEFREGMETMEKAGMEAMNRRNEFGTSFMCLAGG